jgi:hypothetical protein
MHTFSLANIHSHALTYPLTHQMQPCIQVRVCPKLRQMNLHAMSFLLSISSSSTCECAFLFRVESLGAVRFSRKLITMASKTVVRSTCLGSSVWDTHTYIHTYIHTYHSTNHACKFVCLFCLCDSLIDLVKILL